MAILYGDEGVELIWITWVWTVLGSVLFGLRSFNAAKAREGMPSLLGFRCDYILIALAYALAVCAQAFVTVSYRYSTGAIEDPLKQLSHVLYWSIIGQMCAIFSMALGRFSVIAFLAALQGTVSPKARHLLFVLGGLQFCISTCQVFITLLQCDPPRKLWDISLPGSCPLDKIEIKYGYFSGSFGAFTDFVLAIYPAVLIVGPLQQMKLSLKIGICFIMAGGVVAGAAGICLVVYVEGVSYTGGYGTVLTWVMTQTWFIIIFGSLPAIRPVFVAWGESCRTLSARLRSRLSQRRAPTSDPVERMTWVEMQNPHAAGIDRKRGEWSASQTALSTAPQRPGVSKSARSDSDTLFNEDGIVSHVP
ncbi:hypothetical protein DOTSEDRAFT_158433 [Dothistroma septosporum NZE10]|uniref:Rhodopsin domain-containing protein n=1 Tax=Dothistroma septosporum (strain NZE10 / CBS 128990) TaxID=675120 RepID=N1PEY9_DOTSN|nr:hypothetical protein DOTSEDRAFT_158433 [Dothistroma septosporum NZE10]